MNGLSHVSCRMNRVRSHIYFYKSLMDNGWQRSDLQGKEREATGKLRASRGEAAGKLQARHAAVGAPVGRAAARAGVAVDCQGDALAQGDWIGLDWIG
jgi:hypothetical protein